MRVCGYAQINQIDFNLEIGCKSVIIWIIRIILNTRKVVLLFFLFSLSHTVLSFSSRCAVNLMITYRKQWAPFHVYMPIRSFCRSSGRTVSHVVFSTLFSFALFRVLSSLALPLFSYVAVFSIRWFSLSPQSSIAIHTHILSLTHTFIHSFTRSLTLLLLFWFVLFSFYWNIRVLIDFKFNPFGRKFIDFIQPPEWFVGFSYSKKHI